MQLLKITSSPMKYELEIEDAKLEYQQDVTPSCDIVTSPSKLEVKSKNAQVIIDTYESRKSLGLTNIEDSIKQYAEKGKEHISQLTQEYVQDGKAMADIEDGVKISDIVKQKMYQQPELYTAFLPSEGADISWDPASLNVNYQPGDVNLDWQIQQTSYDYTAGSVKMKITQYPHVDIEYLGGPMYVPPSADPNYDDQKEA